MMKGKKVTSEEKKRAIWQQQFEMDGKTMLDEWGYCKEDAEVDRFVIIGYKIG